MVDTLSAAKLRYIAFISYNRADRAVAVALQQRLERFVLPRALRLIRPGTRFDARPLRPVFRDEDELVPGQDLALKVKEALAQSNYLIVLCSPSAAKSTWVEKEIREFRALGRGANILAVVASGNPDAERHGYPPETECLPPALRETEPLWVDWRAPHDSVRPNFLRLVAALLSFGSIDELVRRDAHFQRRRTLLRAGASAAVLLGAVLGFTSYSAAREDAATAKANSLIEASERATQGGNYESAARFALAALRYQRSDAAERALRTAAASNPRIGPPIKLERDAIVAVSPDDKLATFADTGGVTLWDIGGQRALRRLPTKNSTSVLFMHSGALIAGYGGRLHFLDPMTGRELGLQVEASSEGTVAWAFSKGDTLLAASTPDGKIGIWRLAGKRYVPTAVAVPGGENVLAVQFGHDGKRFYTVVGSGEFSATNSVAATLNTWDLETGKPIASQPLKASTEISCASVSPVADIVVTGLCDGLLEVWNADTAQEVGSPLVGHTGEVTAISFSQDGQYFASGGADHRVRLWKVGRTPFFRAPQPLIGHSAGVSRLSFSPDGKLLVSVDQGHEVRIWDLTKVEEDPMSILRAARPFAWPGATSSADRRDQLYMDGTLKRDGALRARLSPDIAATSSLVASCDARPDALVSDNRGQLRFWDGSRMNSLSSKTPAKPSAVRVSPDCKIGIAAFADGTVQGWTLPGGNTRFSFTEPKPTKMLLFMGLDRFATQHDSEDLRVHDLKDGVLVATFPIREQIQAAALSPSGRWLATSASDGVDIWDYSAKRWVGRHQIGVLTEPNAVWFGPDDHHVAFRTLSSEAPTGRFVIEAPFQLSGVPLKDYVCRTTIPGMLSRLTDPEFEQVSALDRETDADACAPAAGRGYGVTAFIGWFL